VDSFITLASNISFVWLQGVCHVFSSCWRRQSPHRLARRRFFPRASNLPISNFDCENRWACLNSKSLNWVDFPLQIRFHQRTSLSYAPTMILTTLLLDSLSAASYHNDQVILRTSTYLHVATLGSFCCQSVENGTCVFVEASRRFLPGTASIQRFSFASFMTAGSNSHLSPSGL